jgi:hypothetical protein
VFLSILFDFRTPVRDYPITLLPTVSHLRDKLDDAMEKETRLKRAAANETDREKKIAATRNAEDAHAAVEIAKARVDIAKYQIPIVSLGIDGATFKCLETRPFVEERLLQLLTVSLDILDKVEGVRRANMLDSLCCVTRGKKVGAT